MTMSQQVQRKTKRLDERRMNVFACEFFFFFFCCWARRLSFCKKQHASMTVDRLEIFRLFRRAHIYIQKLWLWWQWLRKTTRCRWVTWPGHIWCYTRNTCSDTLSMSDYDCFIINLWNSIIHIIMFHRSFDRIWYSILWNDFDFYESINPMNTLTQIIFIRRFPLYSYASPQGQRNIWK